MKTRQLVSFWEENKATQKVAKKMSKKNVMYVNIFANFIVRQYTLNKPISVVIFLFDWNRIFFIVDCFYLTVIFFINLTIFRFSFFINFLPFCDKCFFLFLFLSLKFCVTFFCDDSCLWTQTKKKQSIWQKQKKKK